MTSTQLDHLNRIKAYLETLLANAEKRTPGEWKASPNYLVGGWWVQTPFNEVAETSTADFCKDSDAAFIASCAGNAEAGWRSTLAAIDWLVEMEDYNNQYDKYLRQSLALTILTTWPLESLIP